MMIENMQKYYFLLLNRTLIYIATLTLSHFKICSNADYLNCEKITVEITNL